MTDEHRKLEDKVIVEVLKPEEEINGQIFFLQGESGSGKTFVSQILLARVKVVGRVALPVAQSGIAALFLSGGTTAHSIFKIPIPINAVRIDNILR